MATHNVTVLQPHKLLFALVLVNGVVVRHYTFAVRRSLEVHLVSIEGTRITNDTAGT